MINAIRSIRTQSPTALTFPQSLHPANCYLGRKSSRVGFRQASTTTQSTEPDSEPEMEDKSKDKPHKEPGHGDPMSHSFGEGYSTRCDDDGFGGLGIYGNNQAVDQAEKKELIHENHPDYDRTQGSEVKEKEKARHQTHVASTN